MIIVRCLFLMLFVTCFYGSDALAAGNSAPLASHNFFTPELKPSPDSFKLAKSTFLPETYDDLGLSGRHNTKYDFNKNDCSAYSLSSCPKGATCSKCPFGNRYKLNSCQDGWRISGNSCIAASCSALNSNYKSAIPDNQICTKVTEGGLTCYKDCRAVACDGYKINCDNGVSGSNITSSALCPDCMNDNAKCSPKLCKITACATNYKTNADNTACVEKDDTCPNGYYKTCETSTIGDPKYTERGTACYQCKPNKQQWEICAEKINTSYPGYGILTSTTIPNQGKGYVVVKDLTLTKLPGNVIYGANYFSSIPECATLNRPKITIEYTIPQTPEDGNNCLYASVGGSCKYINVYQNEIDFRDFNIEYKLTNPNNITYPDFYIPIYLAAHGTPSRNNIIKNVTFDSSNSDVKITHIIWAGDYDYSHSHENAYIGNITLNIEGAVKIVDSHGTTDTRLPRLALRSAILNVKSGATFETPGFDDAGYFGASMIIDGTVIASRIGLNNITRPEDNLYGINMLINGSGRVYVTKKLLVTDNSIILVRDGGQLYSYKTERKNYGEIILSGNNSQYSKWDPTTDITSETQKSTTAQKCFLYNGWTCCSGSFPLTHEAFYMSSDDLCGINKPGG